MSRIFLPLPLPLTPRQWFYIGGMQCLVAGLIDGGANFGIAYAMYHGQKDVRMWVFSKNTIAGDLGVTPLIQTAVSMIITSTLVHTDLHHSAIRPLTFVYPHVAHLPDPSVHLPLLGDRRRSQQASLEKVDSPGSSVTSNKRGPSFYFGMLIRFIFEGTENNMILNSSGPGMFFKRLLWTAVQGLGIGVVFGFPLWCLAVVILGPIYGNGNMGNKWAPQVIKLVYAFILGILTNPVIAVLALGSQAEHHLLAVDKDADPEKQAHTTDGEPAAVPVEVAPTPRGPPPSLRSSTRRPSITAYDSTMLVAPPPESFSTPGPSRPRALSQTMSHYSLGGTGGRAQRPRAASRASERSVYSQTGGTGPSIPPPQDTPLSNRAIPPAWRERDGPTTPTGVPPSPSSQARPLGPAAFSRLRSQTNQLDAPRESMEVMAGEDVFGPARAVEGETGPGAPSLRADRA